MTRALAILVCLVWGYLWVFHGRFWSAGPCGEGKARGAAPGLASSIAIVIPARNEAPTIAAALASLLAQDWPGPLQMVMVDDRSTDDTAARARGLADPRLTILSGAPRPPGWSGKLWAVHQGVAAALDATPAPELLLLTDADILHHPRHLATLAARLTADGLDLASEMVELRCRGAAERWLVPAFVFFFQLLYPFAAVNDPRRRAAAAAGGTMLIRTEALARIGGIAALRGALIDDVTLATRVKRSGGRIWLGHTRLARSERPYPGAADIWRMVARTAYTQLRCSRLLLAGCILGMALTWMAPLALALLAHGTARALGAAAYLASIASYVPTLRRFRLSPLRAFALPAIAGFYLAATIGSALDHLRGRGVNWKDRAYTDRAAHVIR